MVRAAVCLLAGVLALGCTGEDPTADAGAERTTQPFAEPSVDDDGRVEVPSLELSLVLPASFRVIDDPDLLLLARSESPRGILSVAADRPEVVDVEPRQGESHADLVVDGLEAVVVTNAALEGLPPGVVANELLVANGARSFSLIMSAGEQELSAMWDEVLSSISIG